MNYLLVCSGNTCRSPMAEAVLRSLVAETDLVSSAGILTTDAMPRSRNAITALREIGLTISGDARRLNPGSMEWADLVLCMEQHHKNAILRDYPEAEMKVMTLGEWANAPDKEISDPFGRSIESYRQALDEISELVNRGIGFTREKADA